MKHIVITGGAGYIGSLLASELLRLGNRVTVLDSMLFGGESLIPCMTDPNFRLVKTDVTQPRALLDTMRDQPEADAIVHLAGIVGFPACQALGKEAAWHYNVEAVKEVYGQAASLGIERFVYSSTYSNYGFAKNNEPVDENAPLHPKSLYAETKVAAEEFLLSQKEGPAPLIFRLATLYGVSPRTRFDLILNQFVLEAFAKRELIIYQRGYSRSFIHVYDVIRGIILGLDAPIEKVNGQVYNLGRDEGNLTKDEIVNLVLKRLPETHIHYKDLTFGGDVRDITVSFEKIKRVLGFEATLTADDGVREVLYALQSGLIKNPQDERYRNARFIVQ